MEKINKDEKVMRLEDKELMVAKQVLKNVNDMMEELPAKSIARKYLIHKITKKIHPQDIHQFFKSVHERYERKVRHESFEGTEIMKSMPSNIKRQHISDREAELIIEFAMERLGQKSGSLGFFWYGSKGSF